ncbi:hypothetical protein C0Q70_13363 [Pomacea canaliculata]|uniref:Cytochrome P450 n=1 Tax=Pomacea canaliculata TaxID=400727 RepID=A0A2T7NX03_POMCA|nr:hypothetical protein C0Q70_13363 [Pomacea canaliculata]
MDPHISRCCEGLSRFLQRLTEKGELVDVKRVFGAYTIDVIAGTAFGMETDFLTNENDAFLHAAMNMIRKSTTFGFLEGFLLIFPILRPAFSFLGVTSSSGGKHLAQLIENLLQETKSKGEEVKADLLQLMLDAEASEAEVAARPQDKHMTKTEIIAQGIIILLAGYETTATTLQYMVYLLATNPDKQEKLYNEIIAAIGDAPPTYENVMGIKYLDNALREALRCFPPVVLFSRQAAETRTIKGVAIPAGCEIAVNIYAVMQDEDFFSEPHKFIPERFDDKNISTLLRELAFGAGPRQCIGMRLALYEAKMAAVTIVRRFKFIKVPETVNLLASPMPASDTECKLFSTAISQVEGNGGAKPLAVNSAMMVFGAYSLDVIAGTAFGMETDFLTNQNDAILQAALNISGKQSHLDILQGFLMVFPILRPLFSFLSVNESSAVKDVIGLIESLIHDRKNNSQSERADFLQLMLDAEASEAEVAARPQDKHMTKVEIIAQGITILLGGYDTTATTLQYLTYLLALNPDRQEKLYHEIIAAIGHAAPTYNNVMSIKYLDNCVWEALRCFPPAVTIIRVAAETRTIKGVLIPAGICIAALLYVIMQDEENFPEPHRFIPER